MVNRIVPADELDEAALTMAKHIAAIDPNLVKETKRAINRALEAQNMLPALEEALAIDLAIEGAGSPDKVQFFDIARRDGLKAAISWPDTRFPKRVHDGALAHLLTDALRGAIGPVESTADAAQTPQDLLSAGQRVAQALAAQHMRPAEPVHVRIGNRPSDLGALLGIWNAGAVAVPVHVSAAPSTVTSLQRATGARLLVDGDRIGTIGDTPAAERPLLKDAALVIFTSGSTGIPKGVVIGHQRLADKIAVLDRLLQFNEPRHGAGAAAAHLHLRDVGLPAGAARGRKADPDPAILHRGPEQRTFARRDHPRRRAVDVSRAASRHVVPDARTSANPDRRRGAAEAAGARDAARGAERRVCTISTA